MGNMCLKMQWTGLIGRCLFVVFIDRLPLATTWPSWSSNCSTTWAEWSTMTPSLANVWSWSIWRTTECLWPRRSSQLLISVNRSLRLELRLLALATWSSRCVSIVWLMSNFWLRRYNENLNNVVTGQSKKSEIQCQNILRALEGAGFSTNCSPCKFLSF